MEQYRNTVGEHELHMFVAKNTSGSTRARGSAVVWKGYDTPGEITQPVSASAGRIAGVVWADIPDVTPGHVVRFGFVYALVLNSTSQAISMDDILIPLAGQDYLVRQGASDGKSGFIFAAEAVAVSNPAVVSLRKVFVRC